MGSLDRPDWSFLQAYLFIYLFTARELKTKGTFIDFYAYVYFYFYI